VQSALIIKDQDTGAVGDAVAEIEAFEPVVGKRRAAIGADRDGSGLGRRVGGGHVRYLPDAAARQQILLTQINYNTRKCSLSSATGFAEHRS